MDSPSKIKPTSQLALGLSFLVLALIILYVSLVRASLNLMTKDNNEDKLRVKPIEYTIDKNDNLENCVYKLPEVTTLPNNPFYLFKQMRDYLWINFTHNPEEKAKILLLLADKKMTETISLYKSNNFDLALDTSEEAINKLKYADKEISELKTKDIKTGQLKEQMIKAGCAYREVLISINKDGKLNENKYKTILTELEKWNEEKQKEEPVF